MKTKDLIELLERNGWKFKRHGANHDIYVKDGQRESVVRHRETDEELAKAIIKRRRAEISPPPLDNNIGGTDNEIQKASECRVLFKVCPRRWKVHDYKC